MKIGMQKTIFFGGASNVRAQVSQRVSASDLNLTETLVFCVSLIKSLQKVHGDSKLHKALCPENIYIQDDGSVVLGSEGMAPLGYMSPEQTGRMNRGVDFRSDFYSLGVVFYELLTGRLPFESENMMELVHSHIAKQPISPVNLNVDIPKTISNIVLKLLSKNAEDRYQSIDGILEDFQRCQISYAETGSIPLFKLAELDICEHLQIPQKLYGREREVEELCSAFHRVAQ